MTRSERAEQVLGALQTIKTEELVVGDRLRWTAPWDASRIVDGTVEMLQRDGKGSAYVNVQFDDNLGTGTLSQEHMVNFTRIW